MKAVIGALRAVLGMDTVAFEAGVGKAQKELSKLNRSFQSAAKSLESVGKTMTVAITAPIAAMGVVTLRAAANFEEGMNRVQAATGATAGEFKALSALALKIGSTTQFSASQAAGALEMLAKNGLNVTQILDGAADATVKLAQANGAELAPAADVVTDIMNQFGKKAGDMGGVVDQVTGTLIASKFGFDDYKLAIGQAGGVAGKVGVSFEDFNAALAVTSSSFASGSDAGTSFKTFLTKLSPTSKEAQEAVKAMRLEFFDATGAMLPMEKIADNLKRALGGLSDEARTNVATKIFGTDSMRTALALASGGADAIRKMREEIAKIDAGDQAATRMKGFNGAVRSLTASIEALQIAIGASGILEWATRMVNALTGFTLMLSRLNPEILKFGTIAAGVAAALGPLILSVGLVVGALGKIPMVLSRVVPAFAPIIALAAPWVAVTVAVVAAVAAVALFADKIPVTSSGAITLADAVRGVTKELGLLFQLVKDNSGWLGRIFDLSDLDSLAPKLRAAFDSLSITGMVQSTAKEIDMIAGLFMGLYEVIVATFKFDGPLIEVENLAKSVQKIVAEWVNESIRLLNWLRAKVGSDPLPLLPIPEFVAKNASAMERAGQAIGEAWKRGLNQTMATDSLNRMIAEARDQSLLRRAGSQSTTPPESGTPSIPVVSGPAPGGGKGGGANPLGGGGGGDNAVKKLREFIEASARAVEVEKMANRERAVSEALYRAQSLAKEAGRKLTDDETAAITRNVLALENAKVASEERTRLENLAKSTIEDTKTAQEKYNDVLRDLNTLLQQGAISQAQFDAARKLAVENMGKNSGGWSTQWQEFADAVSGAARSVASDLLNLDNDIGTTLANMAKRIAEFALEILVLQPIFDAIGKMIKGAFSTSGGGGGGGIGDLIGMGISMLGSAFGGMSGGGSLDPSFTSSSFGGPRAAGGAVDPGHWYRINELGQEEFRPGTRGQVISNRDLSDIGGGSGGGTFNQYNQIHPDVRQTARAVVMDMFPMLAEAGAAKALHDRKRGGRTKEAYKR